MDVVHTLGWMKKHTGIPLDRPRSYPLDADLRPVCVTAISTIPLAGGIYLLWYARGTTGSVSRKVRILHYRPRADATLVL